MFKKVQEERHQMSHLHVNNNSSPLAGMSEKEKVCVDNYIRRMPCKETARELGISHRTVEKYLERVRKRPDFNVDKIFKSLLEEGFFKNIEEEAANV